MYKDLLKLNTIQRNSQKQHPLTLYKNKIENYLNKRNLYSFHDFKYQEKFEYEISIFKIIILFILNILFTSINFANEDIHINTITNDENIKYIKIPVDVSGIPNAPIKFTTIKVTDDKYDIPKIDGIVYDVNYSDSIPIKFIYGVTSLGGLYCLGTLYRYNIETETFNVIHDFGASYITGSDGENPYKKIFMDKNVIYGTTDNGGSYGFGIIWKYQIADGGGGTYSKIADLRDFRKTDVYNIIQIKNIKNNNSQTENTYFNLSAMPNPLLNSTTIHYYLQEATAVNITITDNLGNIVTNLINNESQSSGLHEIEFVPPSNTPTGTYYCTISTLNNIETIELLIVQ